MPTSMIWLSNGQPSFFAIKRQGTANVVDGVSQYQAFEYHEAHKVALSANHDIR